MEVFDEWRRHGGNENEELQQAFIVIHCGQSVVACLFCWCKQMNHMVAYTAEKSQRDYYSLRERIPFLVCFAFCPMSDVEDDVPMFRCSEVCDMGWDGQTVPHEWRDAIVSKWSHISLFEMYVCILIIKLAGLAAFLHLLAKVLIAFLQEFMLSLALWLLHWIEICRKCDWNFELLDAMSHPLASLYWCDDVTLRSATLCRVTQNFNHTSDKFQSHRGSM